MYFKINFYILCFIFNFCYGNFFEKVKVTAKNNKAKLCYVFGSMIVSFSVLQLTQKYNMPKNGILNYLTRDNFSFNTKGNILCSIVFGVGVFSVRCFTNLFKKKIISMKEVKIEKVIYYNNTQKNKKRNIKKQSIIHKLFSLRNEIYNINDNEAYYKAEEERVFNNDNEAYYKAEEERVFNEILFKIEQEKERQMIQDYQYELTIENDKLTNLINQENSQEWNYSNLSILIRNTNNKIEDITRNLNDLLNKQKQYYDQIYLQHEMNAIKTGKFGERKFKLTQIPLM